MQSCLMYDANDHQSNVVLKQQVHTRVVGQQRVEPSEDDGKHKGGGLVLKRMLDWSTPKALNEYVEFRLIES